jgi:hypothetical protein
MRTFRALPSALKPLAAEKRWIVWRWEQRENGKPNKPPFRADAPSKHASSKKPGTWCPVELAMLAHNEGKADGIGFVLTDTNIAAVDLDDCRNSTTGELNPWALNLIERSGSYAEVTPSGEGARIIGITAGGGHLHHKFEVPNANGMSCELYRKAVRIITVTGTQIGSVAKLANIDALLDQTFKELRNAKRAGKRSKTRTTNGTGPRGRKKKLDLDDLIKNGEGGHFGGDRSRAVWFVIHRLLQLGKSTDEIVAILIDPANGIAAHCLDQPDPERHARRQVEKAQEERGKRAAGAPQVLPPPSAPVTVARAFVESRCLRGVAATLTAYTALFRTSGRAIPLRPECAGAREVARLSR